jgi:hypothetical protein
MNNELGFFEAIINAGAILAGFCSTFLVFRIQREASYYRQPALSFEKEKAKDIHIGLTHFTSSFFLIILAAVSSMLFGFVFPLFGLRGIGGALISPPVVISGLIGSLVLLGSYLFDEMVHYGILNQQLVNDAREWGQERSIVIVAILLALACATIAYFVSR